ncbi:flotillin family protein [Mastigocoleus sp. MO_188.B34]|uniref:flotillin family protein n=1 Tax=Mastigocoleus sp. MO_188.B34 TaxID=3036635 RepID=UPI0026331AF4|nr:flotillin family protein [Mastigocoleus sp. MO_188.B34]MDJ0697703.1 flotillin family protein [Mastigocoleus sp. MO_188.B34]
MLFWLTFIELLPLPPTNTLVGEQYNISDDTSTSLTLIAEKPVETSPYIAQISTQPILNQIDEAFVFPGLIAGIIVLILLSIWSYTSIYVITPNNEAFVRTGGIFVKKKTVVLNGGCIVVPGFHELTRVPLREISINVERTGKLAVRTQDYLRANMRVTFYVCINASEEDVLIAAARLSRQGKISAEDITEALETRADDAIRAAAKKKTLAEIDSDKLGFAEEVLNLTQQDLKKVGLTLNNIAISEIEESDTYDTNNFFDAQGVRLRTETIQRSIQQKREVELTTQVAIEQKELDAQKRSLQIAQEKETAELEQKLQVEALTAQRQREIQEAKDKEAAATLRSKILQDKSVEEEEIRKKLSVQQSQIEADIALEDRNKKLKVTQIHQKQEAELAEVTRQQTVESNKLQAQVQIAESEKVARLAQEEVAISIANKKRETFVAQAEQAKAEESVKTAGEIEKAERSKSLSIIAAEEQAQEKNIGDRNVIEIDAFRRRRQAEIAQQAAELEAESIRILADAERIRALAEAEGIQAKITAENTISHASLSAQVITTIWPELSDKLPEIVSSLAPQPGVLGNIRIYSFPGANNNGKGVDDINKLLLSTSGISMINNLLEEGKLGELISQIGKLIHHQDAAKPETHLQKVTDNIPVPSYSHNDSHVDSEAVESHYTTKE